MVDNHKTRLEELKAELEHYDEQYYNHNNSVVDDATYDAKRRQFEELSGKEWAQGELDLVGAAPDSRFRKEAHLRPMLSLSNVFSFEELEDFVKRVESLISSHFEFEFTAEYKFDGVSFSALYEDGKLVKALTRGNGMVGENITENIKAIAGIPHTIDHKDQVEIRGEIYMDKHAFFALNKNQEEKDLQLFANPRNAASGSIRQLDASVTAERNLKYFVWDLFASHVTDQVECMDFAKSLGFITSHVTLCKTASDMQQFFEKIASERASLNYDIDGVVFKLNKRKLQKELGFAGRSPRWAVAYKFPAEIGITKLKGVKFQIGRLGTITPVAVLSPLNIGGVIVTHASLHNRDEIAKKDIRINDMVEVKRAGDVIPYVVKSLKDKRDESAEEISFPTNCPECGSEVVNVGEEVALRCSGGRACRAQAISQLQYFISRSGMNIDGFGAANIAEFYDEGLVRDFIDIFTLEERNQSFNPPLEGRKSWGKKSAENLFKAIHSAKNTTLSRFLASIGIRYIGETVSQIIADNFKDLDDVISALKDATLSEKLIAIDGIGAVSAESFINYFEDEANLKSIEDLASKLTITNQKRVVSTTSLLRDKRLVFTGKLENLSRKEAKLRAENAGASVYSAVTNNVDYLVMGEGKKSGSTKSKAAEALGVKVISEAEFLEMTLDLLE